MKNNNSHERKCSEFLGDIPSILSVPTSRVAMFFFFFLLLSLSLSSLIVARSQNPMWGWPGYAALLQGVGSNTGGHYCIQN